MTRGSLTDRFDERELGRFADELNRDGICVIPGLFDPDVVDHWARFFDAVFKERLNRPGGLAAREQERYYLTLPFVEPFAAPDVFANPVVLGVLDRVFAQEYVLVQLGVDVPLEGSDYQEIHRDYRPLFSDDVVTPLYALAVNFPLVDVTEEMGPFEMARGTHVIPRDEALAKIHSGEITMERFLLKRGDVAIRTPLALHRGTPNRTRVPRPMVVMGYVMHWLHTPKVDLTVPRGFYDALPQSTRALLRCTVADRLPAEKVETYLEFKY